MAATERASAETMAAPASGAARSHAPRELPVISVDMRSTAAPAGRPALADPAGRDLEILSKLGEGGMARVYLARQHSLQRDVAIKTLQENATEVQRRALLEEGVITGFLEHPGVVPVHALGLDLADRPVLVMKRIEGVAWSELLRDAAHPGWKALGGDPAGRLDEHLEILRQVCNAAHFAHSKGVVHRDIKPANVLIGHFGDVYLADWGIAYRVGAGSQGVCGTPGYMAPEMLLGGAIDARTDVYLLGATLHEILSGMPLHSGASVGEILREIAEDKPRTYGPGVPEPLVAIVRRATARDPADRHASAAEFRQELSNYARHKSSIALAASALTRLPRARELASKDQTDEDSQRALDQLVAELRFGLTQSIEQWGGNGEAQRGLAELGALLEARRLRAAEAARIAFEHDPRVSERVRRIGQALVAVTGGALSISAIAKGLYHQPTPQALVLESAVPLVALSAMLIALRRRMRWTTLNRRMVALGLVMTGGMLLGRLLASASGASPAQTLGRDALFLASGLIVSGDWGYRWFRLLALPMLCTAAACAFVPRAASFAFALGSGVVLFSALVTSALSPQRTDQA